MINYNNLKSSERKHATWQIVQACWLCMQASWCFFNSVPSMLYIHVAAATTIGWQAGQKPSTSKHGDDGRGACFGTMHAARPEAVVQYVDLYGWWRQAGRSSRTTSNSDNEEAHECPTVQRRGGRRLRRTGYRGEEARGWTSTELADDPCWRRRSARTSGGTMAWRRYSTVHKCVCIYIYIMIENEN